MSGLFVTGTDTDIGKSVVAAWITHHWSADYWKPVQSGLDGQTDSQTATQLANLTPDRVHPESFRLNQPLSPHASAAIDGVEIELASFSIPQTERPLVVEGAGGILVPLNDSDLVVDLMHQIAFPVVVVARSGLGTINHTLLTLSELRRRKLEIVGVIMNGPENESNRHAIQHYGKTPVLANFPWIENLNHSAIAELKLPAELQSFLESIS